jgi:hypothetical protein
MDSHHRLTTADIDDVWFMRPYIDYDGEYGAPWTYFTTVAGIPPKLVVSKLYKMVRRGLLDYGVSERMAFLTTEGRAWWKEHGDGNT